MSEKLLTNLNFAELISKNDAITEAGKEMLNGYRGYCYANPVSCSLVNGFIAEASKYGFDTGLTNILESVNSFIKENNISWKLASACESINANNSTYNYINKIGVQQVSKLLEMNEAEVISYIKAGSLKNIQYIPEFRAICKEVYKTQVTEAQAVNYSVVNPISYVINEEKEDGTKNVYFKALGTTFMMNESGVTIVTAPVQNETFNHINSLLENMGRDGDSIYYEFKGGRGVYRFEISESVNEETNESKAELTFKATNINEKFEDHVAFRQYCDNLSKVLPVAEKLQLMKVSTAIADVFENMESINLIDNCKLLKSSNATCAIIECKDKVNLTVFNSINAGSSSVNYDYMVEALNNVVKVGGVDLKSMYEDRINEDMKKLDPEAQQIKEQLEANKEAQYSIRKKKIAMLAEQYKNDPVRIALLNKVAKDLAILEKQDTKVIEKNDPNPDDDCPCGSGKKFKDCCGKK